MDRRVTPPKRLTSPTWGPPPPCKQALRKTSIQRYEIPQNRPFSIPFLTLIAFHRVKKSQLIIEIVDRIKIKETPSLILEHLARTSGGTNDNDAHELRTCLRIDLYKHVLQSKHNNREKTTHSLKEGVTEISEL